MFAISAAFAGVIGCNKKDDDTIQTYTPEASVAVSSFSLKSDDNVAENLDKLFFSIDLERGLIFNADSLPVGTNISALVPKMSYSTTVGGAELQYVQSDGTIASSDFMATPNAAIDFRNPVSLILTSSDGSYARTYTIRVNVHKTDPSLLGWSDNAVYPLPSRLGSPREQKTVEFKSAPLTLIEERDGTFTLASGENLFVTADDHDAGWKKEAVSLPFTPEISSFVASEEALFMLGTDGSLWTSTDGRQWNVTSERWRNIVCAYASACVLGIKEKDGKLVHCSWPSISGMTETVLPSGFPVRDFSNAGSYSNKWSQKPLSIICGGTLADGSVSPCTWAFDGSSWALLSGDSETGSFPAVKGATLVPYWISTPTTGNWKLAEHDAWLLMGGTLADGSLNREVWYSLNNGVSWTNGGDAMKIPDTMPAFTGADNVVSLFRYSSDALAWRKSARKRINASIDGQEITWECPYIFIFGGRDFSGNLLDAVWRGAINRQRFVPVL